MTAGWATASRASASVRRLRLALVLDALLARGRAELYDGPRCRLGNTRTRPGDLLVAGVHGSRALSWPWSARAFLRLDDDILGLYLGLPLLNATDDIVMGNEVYVRLCYGAVGLAHLRRSEGNEVSEIPLLGPVPERVHVSDERSARALRLAEHGGPDDINATSVGRDAERWGQLPIAWGVCLETRECFQIHLQRCEE